MGDEKHLDTQLHLLASKLRTPWGPKMAAGILATKTKMGAGVDVERTTGPCHSVFLGFFLLGETHTVQGHTSLAGCGRWWEEKQWEQWW